MKPSIFIAFATAILGLSISVNGSEIDGTWTAVFDTQVGSQEYTYEFKADDETLTGKAISPWGTTEISEGTIKGDTVSFVENLNFQGEMLRITYTGTLNGDEIEFTRNVADFATEKLTAKRADD